MFPLSELRLVGVALLIAALLGGVAWFRIHEKAQVRAAVLADRQDAAAAAAIRQAQQAAAQKEISNESQRLAARAADDAADARAADVGLLQRAVAAGRRAAPAAAPGSAPASGPELVPADVLRGALADARRLAELADQRGIAGAACERSYDALTR